MTSCTDSSYSRPLGTLSPKSHKPTAGHSSTLPVPLDSIHMQIILLKPLFDLYISFYIFAKAVGANLQTDSWIWLERGLSIFAMVSVLMHSSGLLNSLSAQCHAFLRVSCGTCTISRFPSAVGKGWCECRRPVVHRRKGWFPERVLQLHCWVSHVNNNFFVVVGEKCFWHLYVFELASLKFIFLFFLVYRKEILSEVSFTVMPGQTVALVKLHLNCSFVNIVY